MRGWVYIIANKSLPNLLKIGFSTKDPIIRAQEFNGTGIPYDFQVLYDAIVINPREVEQRVHKHLAINRENKEWFRIDLENAISAIRFIANDIILENFHAKNLDIPKQERDKSNQLNITATNKCHFINYGNCNGEILNYKGVFYCEKHNSDEKKKRFAFARANISS